MSEWSFEADAIAAYRAAAGQVTELLGTAAAEVTTAAQADLSGLGVLGREFAQTWARVVGDHATTLTTAGELVAAYSKVLGDYGTEITGIDADVAAALAAIEPMGEVA